ncbi:protein NLP5-like [Coffea arabica]|uniref:Protein NLP5-like n=1 Tax=Coffea arabica TaxID=13443 RepID=A0ABM4UG69_COFAR
MVQFWAPFTVGGRLLLKTSDHPFGLTSLRKGFCSYRKLCLNYSYVVDEEAAEEYNHHGGGRLGKDPPSHVFQTGLPEYSPDIKFYSNQEFPLRDDAIHRGMKYYLAVPVFEPDGSQDCIGVLEFLYNPHLFPMQKLTTFVRVISATLKAVELRTSDYYYHLDMENDLANVRCRCSIIKISSNSILN